MGKTRDPLGFLGYRANEDVDGECPNSEKGRDVVQVAMFMLSLK